MSVLRRLFILASVLSIAACDAGTPTIQADKSSDTKAENSAVQVAEAPFDESKLRERFESMGVSVIDIQPATIKGLYEVDTDGGLVFSTAEGDQFISGTLYALNDNGGYVDVLAERQAPLNAAKIEEHKDDMIIYPAENEKYVITVFTDTTCGYCVRLHHQMNGYNELGITVRYLAYPRQGPNGDVAGEMARIWCAENPAKAMDQAKDNHSFNEEVENIEQCEQNIAGQYALGRELGISGTPAVFLPNGKLVAGYMPPAGMYQRIQQEMGM